ncbi:MAG: GIY-YIG nuclease family protein [Candidatus Marinimicrobia bacterium]|nr:GIY-YIG nuclease family protein [Candidatus Neomarinimicrobiota bacterium]
MFYVYILRSQKYPDRHYTGFTKEISKRLLKHNYGEVKSTARYKPWKVETLISFDSQDKAISFEKYLKSHSGRAFASKHF